MLTFPVYFIYLFIFFRSAASGAPAVFSEAQWRSVQVARLSSPPGIFLLLFPSLHRCLLAYMSCHMFSARPPPEGAKSAFARNLHRLTRPTLTGTHGVYGEQRRHYSACRVFSPFSLFFFFLFSVKLPQRCPNALQASAPPCLHVRPRTRDEELYSQTRYTRRNYALSKDKKNIYVRL